MASQIRTRVPTFRISFSFTRAMAFANSSGFCMQKAGAVVVLKVDKAMQKQSTTTN